MKTFEEWFNETWDGMDGLDEIDKMERAWKAGSEELRANLARLVERHYHMANVRRETADNAQSFSVIRDMEGKAACYERCASEIKRALSGETPPAPEEEWEVKQ